MKEFIQNYISKPLIKADDGSSLYDYWYEIYQTYTIYELNSAFKNALENIMLCERIINKKKTDEYVLEIFCDKLQIYLTHSTIINEFRNKLLNITDNKVYDMMIYDIEKNELINKILMKIKNSLKV